MIKLNALHWLLPMTALACVGRGETLIELNYDYGTLDTFRSAIPTEERLVAGVPAAAGGDTTGADDAAAVLAEQGVVFARGINMNARDVARTLQQLASEDPDHFNPEREEFIWGPWRSPSGPGELTLSIQRHPSVMDFEYSYALIRSMPGDEHSDTPVIWGGANLDPDNANHGTGLTAVDLDANAAFEAAHGEEAELDPAVGQGRFAMVHGYAKHGSDSVFFNRASFRDYVPPAESRATMLAPATVEHFYGRMAESSGTIVDFLHSEIDSDLCGADPNSCFGTTLVQGHPERFVFGEFVVDNGPGRAEVQLSGGDLASQVEMTECWNASLTRTSYQLTTDDGTVQMMPSASCPGRAAQSSEELGLPTADDVQPWLLYALGCAVESNCSGG
jgi:hypothetical protein